MGETFKILFKVALALIGGGAIVIALCIALFTAIMFLVPTSSPFQAEEWTKTVITFGGIQITQMWIERLKVAALGVGLIIPFSAIAWFSWWLLNKQQ